MKFKTTAITQPKEILYNDHYVAIPYDCSEIDADANGVIKAGTIIPANDDTAIGVLLSDVVKAENPNGTIVIHGFIKTAALPVAPSEDTTAEVERSVTMTVGGEEVTGTFTEEVVTAQGAKSVLKQINFM